MAVVKRKMPREIRKKARGPVDDSPVTDLSLPTKKSVPSTNLQDFTLLIFGRPKIGKTELSSMFPDTFHQMTEPGGRALSIYQKPVDRWKDFLGYNKLLRKDRNFRTVSIDTADNLYQHCFDHVTQRLGVEHPSEEAYGKGWKAIRDEFSRGMTQLMGMGKGVILISHDVEKKIKERNGGEYDRIVPTLSGQGRDIIEPMVDLFFYMHYDGDQRVLTIAGDEHIAAGHRLTNNFRYPSGRPIRKIPMGRSAKEGYANLLLAFSNQLPEPARDEEAPAKKKKTVIKKKR